MRTIYSDVLCIGAGLAGERVALAAAMEGFHTICLSVVPPRRSHSSAAQGGMQAALGNAVMGKGDSTDIHFADTVKGSDWGCDQEVARIFADSAPIVMREMAHWGVPWNRVVAGKHTYYKGGKPFEAEEEESKHGLIHARAFGGTAKWRTCYTADGTGRSVLNTLDSKCLQYGVEIHDRMQAEALIHDGERCMGAIVRSLRDGELVAYIAKATLIATGGYGTPAVSSVGKIQLTDADGPASLNNNFTGVGSIGFPASTAFACTWNKDLAKQFGEMIGDMAHDMHVAGWYAPAMNIHRNAFSGRTFEYFSEDALLSGAMASNEIAGAKEKGVYSFMKHFALNDQETKRTEMLCTWTNEQAMREIYLKPFEMSVKEGGAQAVMSAFNYIGNTYAGGNNALLNTVLRDEWGFKGFVLTDYFGGYGYQNGDQEIRNGNDSMLATTKITNHITDKSATSVKAMRTAAHNILYTAANSWQYADGEPKVDTPIWKTAMYVAWGVTAVLVIALEALAIKRYMDRKKAKAEISA